MHIKINNKNIDLKMAVFDIDNTLFSHVTNEIPLSTIEAINKLKEKNIKIVIATGRGLVKVYKEVLDLKPDYWVVANGQQILNNNYDVLYSNFIPNNDIERMNQYALKKDIGLIFKFEDFECLYSNKDIFYKRFEKYANRWILDNSTNYNQHLTNNCIGGCLLGNKLEQQQFLNEFKEYVLLPQGDDFADITIKGTNKYTGIKYLEELLNMDDSNVIAFGDAENDAEILQNSIIGVCMGNGFDKAKKVSDYITETSENNGIFNALRHFKII